jgi:hypothetical protein
MRHDKQSAYNAVADRLTNMVADAEKAGETALAAVWLSALIHIRQQQRAHKMEGAV